MSNVPVLFDVNASFGRPSEGGSDYPVLGDRLAEMNRLGISRALVWNADAVQNNALASNDNLLAQIRATPGAAGRIFPALAVSGLFYYEHRGAERFEAQMKAMPCRAIRFVGGQSRRLTLMQLEPVMRRIRRLKPFIILKYYEASVEDILEFSETFPDVNLVLTEVVWGGAITAFDLMRRRRNVLIDLSWTHTFNTIEMLVKQFGADRVVFGMGYKSQNGAAMAALARASITAGERQMIAHGNLDRLTGLKTRAVKVPAWTANTLWPRFLEGERLEVDIVDAHGHLGPSNGYVVLDQEESAQLKAGLRDMDKIGINLLVLSGMQAIMADPVAGNDIVEKHLRPHAGRVAGYVAYNPFYAGELVPRLDSWFAGSVFKGFKTLCDYWKVPITDKRFIPMWEYANRHRLPVLCHTWGGSQYDSPAMLKVLAKKHPNVGFLVGHTGGGDSGRREAEELARKHSNVYLETCGSFCSTVLWEDTLKRVSPRQVVFGTDAMAHDFNWELGRLLSCNLPDKVLIPILGGNMRRILSQRR